MAYKKALVFLICTHISYASFPLSNISEHRRVPFPNSITVPVRDEKKNETYIHVRLNSAIQDMKESYLVKKKLPKTSLLNLELRYRPEECKALIEHQEFLYMKSQKGLLKQSKKIGDQTAHTTEEQEQYECQKIIGSLANETPVKKLFAGRWILFGWYGLDVREKK